MSEHEHALTVPREEISRLRFAAIGELQSQAESVKGDVESLDNATNGRGPIAADDLQNSLGLLNEDAALAAQLARAGDDPQEAVTVTGPADTLAHVLHFMAEREAGGLNDALSVHPLDADGVRARLDSLTWAIDNAERFQDAAQAEREAVAG